MTIKQPPILYGDGEHDDHEALQALFNGEPVMFEGKLVDENTKIEGRHFAISKSIEMKGVSDPSDPPIRGCRITGKSE